MVCSCASATLAFHGLCPQVCRSRNLMPFFTEVPPQYLSYLLKAPLCPNSRWLKKRPRRPNADQLRIS
ncbi:hypothetical protein WRSd3_p00301 (plasmid) [Shigella dysenteriae WRSd3]|uniref:Uncharacterized protein n=1 Tax=Shigella dysenteriae WRSd3 TaxID=1401327 RepID=A0A090NA58_SHIDY|nr:hypothetical protein WRSd3_p00301 [Shigella dysenteriae WRSd3]